MALTLFTLGFQVLLERLWEWLTLIPKVTLLSQNSHLAKLYTSFDKRLCVFFKKALYKERYLIYHCFTEKASPFSKNI